MLPNCFEGVYPVMIWPTVNDPTSIVIDSEKVLREGTTISKTFNHELQILKNQPQIVFSKKVKPGFDPSLNHLQKWNLILVVSGNPVDTDKVDDKEKEKDTSHDNNTTKISVNLYSDEPPFNKKQSFQVEQEHF